MTNYYIFGFANDYCDFMLHDISPNENVVFINRYHGVNGFLTKVLYKMNHWEFMPDRIKGILDRPWFQLYLDGKFKISKEKICCLFFDANQHAFKKEFLMYLKKKYRSTLVILLINPIKTKSRVVDTDFIKTYYDFALTIFPEDASKYDLIYYDKGLYSKVDISDVIENKEKTDVFFVGDAKDRMPLLLETYKYLMDTNISCEFYIDRVNEPIPDIDKYKNIIFNKRLPYHSVLSKINGSKCILEILQEDQSNSTLRYSEAVVYNRKLITNNSKIQDSKYYNDQYIKIFKKPREIDLDFIKSNVQADYSYQNDFSPSHLIEYLSFLINKRAAFLS